MMNDTLYIDPCTRDLAFDDHGLLRMVQGDETTAQNVRMTLLAGIGSFFLEPDHGTDYHRFLGQKDVPQSEIRETLREAIYQEPDIAEIANMEITHQPPRGVEINFDALLQNGTPMTLEVNYD